ncbi:hypothetical protein RYX36_023037 [Vicia faba]
MEMAQNICVDMSERIAYLCKVIPIMENTIPKSKKLYHQLCNAYCLRALSKQTIDPKSNRIVKDCKAALSLWMKEDIFPTIMFHNIIDLL